MSSSYPEKSIKQKKTAVFSLFAAVMLAAFALAGCSSTTASVVQPQAVTLPTAAPANIQAASLYDEGATVALYERAIPAVVEIESTIEVLTKLNPFGFNVPNQQGQGSGFIIDDQGHILTNNHVVDKATKVKVRLNEGTQIEAKVLGVDRNNDVALLQVDASKISNYPALPLGDSDQLKPGQMAIALGSPYGLQGSITVGIISGVGRSITGATERQMTNIIQTDAAINPGNSGGPLLNSRGEVIGINTAIEYDANSVGFCVPINTAKALLPRLISGENIKSAWLGIEGMPLDTETAKKLNVSIEKGVYVINVIPSGPAEKAGLKGSGRDVQNVPTGGGDIILAVDEKPVSKVQDLIAYFNTRKPGDEVTLTVQRGNEKISVPVELGEWPEKLTTSTLPDTPDGNEFDFGPFKFRWK
ncbi:MAG: trypsin-like peptidase domain-containing protein [Dehalococcoidia bacterium]|nr:trypsin-like peptidase domain-containing protein [Dehalococcoidia bacterium]MDD5494457.1 trypsin-like peptidase domain-containing protein [Dehalococcoidia bacterium]